MKKESNPNFPIGSRVELKPHLDSWMRGDRYGDVIGYRPEFIRVKLDKSKETRLFKEEDLTLVPESMQGLLSVLNEISAAEKTGVDALIKGDMDTFSSVNQSMKDFNERGVEAVHALLVEHPELRPNGYVPVPLIKEGGLTLEEEKIIAKKRVTL